MKERKHEAPPRYDAAFKEGAIRLVTEEGRPMREVAKELGVCTDTIRNWLKASGIRGLSINSSSLHLWESLWISYADFWKSPAAATTPGFTGASAPENSRISGCPVNSLPCISSNQPPGWTPCFT